MTDDEKRCRDAAKALVAGIGSHDCGDSEWADAIARLLLTHRAEADLRAALKVAEEAIDYAWTNNEIVTEENSICLRHARSTIRAVLAKGG
jgi:hypothetical protein